MDSNWRIRSYKPSRRGFLALSFVGLAGTSAGCLDIFSGNDEPANPAERFEAALTVDGLRIESIEHRNGALNVIIDYTGDLSEPAEEIPHEDEPRFEPPSSESIIDVIIEVIENHDDVDELSIMFIDSTCTASFRIDDLDVLAYREGVTDRRSLQWAAVRTYQVDCP